LAGFVITGGIARNAGVVTRIGEKLDGLEISISEPMIACDRVRTKEDA
jgi:hypothetical protein